VKKKLILWGVFILVVLSSFFIEKTLFSIVLYSAIIVSGAIIIAWSAESSEVIISQGLALAIVALVQVLPEFIIEATIAWAQDVPNMLANFTGANRILTGVGWPLVFFTTFFFAKRKQGRHIKEIVLKEEHSLEVIFFMLATLYSIIIYLRGALTLFDSVVMVALYVTYLRYVSRLPHLSRKKTKKMLGGVPKKISRLPRRKALLLITLLFIIGGCMIYFAAEPFYTTSLVVATSLGISQFLFIQWIAPFLSEFPEKTSAFYWASKIKQAPMALMNLISSKLTQWTILLAMIPLVFSFSVGALSHIPLDSTITSTDLTISTEMLLTIATSLYASTFLLKLRFTWIEALILFVLWCVQFIFVHTRSTIIIIYFVLTGIEIIIYRKEMKRAFIGFHKMYKQHIRKR